MNKPDSTYLFLKPYCLFQTPITNKKDNKGNLPKINISPRDLYREKFSNLNLINILGSHVSK